MTPPIRWGILGTGKIARGFAQGLADANGADLVAVGSRTQASADAFADQFGVPRRHASYEALAADPEVDVVYVATPHPMHCANTLLLIEHGKAVLCEKPFAMDAREAERMIALARARGVFLMEAMWTRFLPAIVELRHLIDAGTIGAIRSIHADFGFRADFDPDSRLFAKRLGGGALLDVGIYPVAFTSMLLGPHPEAIATLAELGRTGVDEQSAVLLRYASGALAVLSGAIRTQTATEATVYGTDGWIRLHTRFHQATRLTITRGEHAETRDAPMRGNGYNYEAEEVGRCLRAGLLESSMMPLEETRAITALMEEIRDRWGLDYTS